MPPHDGKSKYFLSEAVNSRVYFSARAGILLLMVAGAAMAGQAQRARSAEAARPASKPLIAVFSGFHGTIQHIAPLVTSNKARAKYGLPLATDPDGSPARFDMLRPQRLAAPVTVYIEAYSAHPLEADAAELYAPPDGYLNRQTRVFSKQRQSPDDIPVYEATLNPEDGVYPLPYMARQVDGSAWEEDCAYPKAPLEKCRVPYYPDGSRSFEEIDRLYGNLLSSQARFDFYRADPPGGYRKGLAARLRTDMGEGDIPKEGWGEDFFPYGPPGNASSPQRQEPPRARLANATNVAQRALRSKKYAGAVWLGGSPYIEEVGYWLNLLIDTPLPISVNASQSVHGALGNDGDRNVVDSVRYILSGIWKDAEGKDKIGVVITQEKRVITAREVQKTGSRPGSYLPQGGFGGFVASTTPMVLTFVPARKHTYTSEVNMTKLPTSVQGVRLAGNRITTVSVPIKDAKGELLPTAIPRVTIAKFVSYEQDSSADDPSSEVEVAARIEKNLHEFPLAGFVLEGSAGYGQVNETLRLALERAALRGMPVVTVGRGNNEGFISRDGFFIGGGNLTSPKARLLLMACLMKFGSLPVPADPDHATKAELDAIQAKMNQYQEIFDTH